MKKLLCISMAVATLTLNFGITANAADQTKGKNIKLESISSTVDNHTQNVNKEVKTKKDFFNVMESKYPKMNAKVVASVPENVTPVEFSTWSEALDWIEQLHKETEEFNEKHLISSLASYPGMLNDGYQQTGDVGGTRYNGMPSGASTFKDSYSYDVPGVSAQTVKSEHYFEYSNGVVTTSTRHASISGLGLATYKTTYSQLERYKDNYYSVLKGDLGYYVSIGGVNVGFSDELELTYCLYNTVY